MAFMGIMLLSMKIRPMENLYSIEWGMIACAYEQYTVNLTSLKFFTVMYIQPFIQWLVRNIGVKICK